MTPPLPSGRTFAAAAMDCRIEVVDRPDGPTVLLAGRLMAAQVHELWGTCAAIGRDVRVDLSDLLSADPGLSVIMSFPAREDH